MNEFSCMIDMVFGAPTPGHTPSAAPATPNAVAFKNCRREFGAVGQSPYRVQQIDPHGDSVHMGNKNRMKPAVSDKLGRGRISLAASFTQKVSFGSSYDGTVHPRSRPRHRRHRCARRARQRPRFAVHAKAWGYRRIWVAEHHNMPGIVSAATSVVIGHIAAGTKTIRVGAGGIMLPNHAPYVIAEQFG